MIHDVVTYPLRQIFDERGKVMHMLREDSCQFKQFGEIYFSTVNPGAIKAWRLHKLMTLNYAVVHGHIKLVLYDDRYDSPSYGVIQELFISPENYQLITIPPLIWNGFKCVGPQTALVANCATIKHSNSDILRLPFDDKSIPYGWSSNFF